MSLALIVIGDRSAAVATDGAITRRLEDGTLLRAADDYKKFREVAPGIAIVAMGTTWLSDRVYPAVEAFLTGMQGQHNTFQVLTVFLATFLPFLHCEHEAVAPTFPDGVRRGEVALVGLDRESGRARLVLFSERTGYKPDESMTAIAMGWTDDEYPKLAKAYEVGTDGHAWADVMARIIAQSSQRSEYISGTAFALTIEWKPTSGSVGRSFALSRRAVEYTTSVQ